MFKAMAAQNKAIAEQLDLQKRVHQLELDERDEASRPKIKWQSEGVDVWPSELRMDTFFRVDGNPIRDVVLEAPGATSNIKLKPNGYVEPGSSVKVHMVLPIAEMKGQPFNLELFYSTSTGARYKLTYSYKINVRNDFERLQEIPGTGAICSNSITPVNDEKVPRQPN
jgi:hypothetical protein